ncbi:biopolymer transport protein ExbB/TolQ [Salirhabdus euzebyi]|uniref:Biopolymer transport protein ExbB/TolQ n=1 Tax=Salirhabdus euzebyi TaxID=394506 RepID=A0A841Q884_9BACI|nr:MotA/TolQ/ExbB proton channel family protein [Salirhabdus euzebyi]MBB6454809.1 biopolymer transport protein ExbB/TolQ [Salirhabdus euzebyi]
MFDLLPANNEFARYIIIITFLFLLFVSFRVIYLNLSLFNYLKKQLDTTERNPENSRFWKNLKEQYDLENRGKNDHIDVQAFVESYMSNYTTSQQSKSILSNINRIHSAGSTVILIGVLGTFVGLISALYGLDLNGEEMQSSIQNVLDGIYTAFYTSVFGIAASLIITYVHKNWDTKHLLLRLTLRAENLLQTHAKNTWESRMIDSLDSVKIAITDMHSSLAELDDFSQAMESASGNMVTFNEKFERSANILYETFENMEKVGENFNRRMDVLNKQFDTFVNQMEKQEASLKTIDERIRGVSDHISLFIEKATKNIHDLTEENKNYLQGVEMKLDDSFRNMSGFYTDSLRQLTKMVDTMSELEHKNEAFIANVGKATETMKEVLKDRTFDQLAHVTRNFSENVMLLENHFQRLQDHYDRMEKEKKEFMSFYQQQREELVRMREEIHNLSSNNEGVRRQFEDIKFVFEQADKSNRELIQQSYELTRDVKDSLKQNSQEQANQMKQVMYDFHNQINDAFRNLDNILGKNLANSIDKFEQYVSSTNQAIERQFNSVNEFVNNSMQSSNREVLNAVGDIRNRIDQWDQQMKQSVRNRSQRENRD